jgi:hypothetical protein
MGQIIHVLQSEIELEQTGALERNGRCDEAAPACSSQAVRRSPHTPPLGGVCGATGATGAPMRPGVGEGGFDGSEGKRQPSIAGRLPLRDEETGAGPSPSLLARAKERPAFQPVRLNFIAKMISDLGVRYDKNA